MIIFYPILSNCFLSRRVSHTPLPKIKFTLESSLQLSDVKPKPKLSLWPITTEADNQMYQSEIKANICSRRQARGNADRQVTLTNHNRGRQFNEPIKTQSKTCSWRQARENAYRQVTLANHNRRRQSSDWLIKWREIFLTNNKE